MITRSDWLLEPCLTSLALEYVSDLLFRQHSSSNELFEPTNEAYLYTITLLVKVLALLKPLTTTAPSSSDLAAHAIADSADQQTNIFDVLDVEDFAESIVRRVFGDAFEARCTFRGKNEKTAKCDFAIPSRLDPRIVIESKGYGATGSKMTDVIGDIEKKSYNSYLLQLLNKGAVGFGFVCHQIFSSLPSIN